MADAVPEGGRVARFLAAVTEGAAGAEAEAGAAAEEAEAVDRDDAAVRAVTEPAAAAAAVAFVGFFVPTLADPGRAAVAAVGVAFGATAGGIARGLADGGVAGRAGCIESNNIHKLSVE